VGTDRLSRTTVAEHALKLADAEGLSAVTIRRLAQDLGVTPMALYWHFKNKDELLLGMADHMLSGVRASREPDDPWLDQLRAMAEALVDVMRAHPCLPELLQTVDKQQATSFTRATNDVLELLGRGGFGLEEGYWIASYLLHGAIGLVAAQPDCPSTMTEEQAVEWRRQKRLAMEQLPADRYPHIVALARSLGDKPDVDRYYRFGIDLLLAGISATRP
jgi:AcrR family transcriptional regulator